MKTHFPASADEVLRVIKDAECHRKFVWTAGRILKEAALWTQAEALAYEDRKLLLRRVTDFLQELAAQGVLDRRGELQSIGYGDEIGFDFRSSRPGHKPTDVFSF